MVAKKKKRVVRKVRVEILRLRDPARLSAARRKKRVAPLRMTVSVRCPLTGREKQIPRSARDDKI